MSTLIRESSSSRVWKRQTSIERPKSTHADVSAFVFQVARLEIGPGGQGARIVREVIPSRRTLPPMASGG
jgi:hypothetical protein